MPSTPLAVTARLAPVAAAWALVAALAVALPPSPAMAQDTRWPDPVAHHVVPYETAGLALGPAVGAPAADSARVWVRTTQPAAFRIVYAPALPLDADCPGVDGQTSAAADNTGWVQLAGLQANTRYFYGVMIGGQLADTRIDFHDPWPSFRTLPDGGSHADADNNPGGRFNVCFSVGCCACQDPIASGGQYGSPPTFATLLDRHGDEIQFHWMNGDTIYEERRDGTLEGVRENYRLYWSRGRSFADAMRRVPILFTYDDHEIGWDIHGSGEIGLGAGKHLWRDIGLRAWGEYCEWANPAAPQRGCLRFGRATVQRDDDVLLDPNADFATLDPATVSTIHVGPWTRDGQPPEDSRRNAGVYRLVEVLDQHRLRVEPAFRADEQPAYSIGTHHWFDWQLGNCHFFVLDTRGERSRPNFKDYADPSRFVLGPAQQRWLMEGVANTDADFVFVISPDPWIVYHTAYHVGGRLDPKGDGFASFVHQRELLLNHFDQLDKPVLIFTGDVHNSLAARITDNVWEFLCGPMGSNAHPVGTAGGMPYGGRWTSQGRPVTIRWIAGFPDNVHYSRLRNAYYAVVQVNNVLKAPRPDGVGYQFVAYDVPQVVVRFHNGYSGRLEFAEAITPGDGGTEAP